MISSQIVQTTLDELKAITKVDMGVYDTEWTVIASTMAKNEVPRETLIDFAASAADSQVIGEKHLVKIYDGSELLFVLVAKGAGEDTYMVAKIAVCQLKNLAIAYKDRFDRNHFFQNLLLDNLLLVDIYNRAQKLHLETNLPRAVFIVETGENGDDIATELLKGMFSEQAGDYITAVDEKSIVLIKAFAGKDAGEELEEVANTIVDMMNSEAMQNVRVACGTVVSELKDISKSYKEAKLALEVGSIFYEERSVASYSALGIGRLIYQLPVNLCKLFIREIFGDSMPEELDEETLNMLNRFFENNLNISETSRQLFVHRNTLMYRIEKILKSTGLDLRSFDDALTFKIALMVVKYMDYLDGTK